LENNEIMSALLTLKKVSNARWLKFMKMDDDHLPYFISDVSRQMEHAVYERCPPGFEVDR
jgi:hypothetical protein